MYYIIMNTFWLQRRQTKTLFFWLLCMINMETDSKIYFIHDCKPTVYIMITIEMDSTIYFSADFKPHAYIVNTIETDNNIYFLSWRGNQECTVQRHCKHWAHKAQEEDKQNTHKKLNKKTSNTDPNKCRE
jgi:hypothetical protein